MGKKEKKKKHRSADDDAQAAKQRDALMALALDEGGKKLKKHTGQDFSAIDVATIIDNQRDDLQELFASGVLSNGHAGAKWPILLLRQALLLVVDGIDSRYGLAGRRANTSSERD